ncbi:MAG: hypothetical protein Q4G62_01260 [Pseudomonadota bacterium]|nr:hypothetical protein [Pseudomonadota bacterium]
MNHTAPHTVATAINNTAPVRRASTPASAPLQRRQRDLGVGYGRSSGYADGQRRYAPVNRSPEMFRVC